MKKIYLVILLVFGSILLYGDSRIDSLLVVIENMKDHNEQKLSAYEKLLNKLRRQEDFADLVLLSEKAIRLAETHNHTNFLAKFYCLKANAESRMGNYTEALSNFNWIIAMDNNGIEQKTIMLAFSGISENYQKLGDFQKAYEYQIKALIGFEELNDVEGICRSNYLLGTIFYYQKQYEKALNQYQKALTFAKTIKKSRSVYSSLGAIGATYQELGNEEKSFFFNMKALQLAKELNYESGIAYSLNNVGTCYLKKGNCKKAESAMLESINIKKRINDSWGILGSKFSLIEVYQQCQRYDQVLPNLEDALKMAKKLGAKARELDAYQKLADYYDDKNTATAYQYAKKYIALKKIILNEKTLEEMGKSQQRYELAKKEHQISILKTENRLLNVNEENQKLYKLIYLGAIFFLIVTAFWFFSRIKTHRKVNQMLTNKNDLLNLKNEEIRIKNKQLEHSNEDLTQFAYVASHDLKEPLRMIHSYTTLLDRRYKGQLDETGQEFMHFVIDAVDRMKNLLDDLLDYSRSGKQEMPDKLVSVKEVMVSVAFNLQKQVEDQKGSLIVRNENLPDILAHQSQLMQLLQNLVSNGLKFCSGKDPVVVVDCKRKNNQFIFFVKDNGIGISKSNQEKVFEMFRRLHTRQEYAGSGLGLAICKKIVSNMGGDIWLESEEGNGSTFFFAVPCPSESLVSA